LGITNQSLEGGADLVALDLVGQVLPAG